MASSSNMRSHSSSCSRFGYCHDPDGYSDDEECCDSKRRRIIKKDLLSSLPEAMICHIFSFMPIKDIVKTSALSKRWRFMWYKTPTISFSYPDKHSRFKKFHPNIDRVLMLCTSLTIQKFHLIRFQYHPSMKKKLDLWLQFAVARCAKDIHLGLYVAGGEQVVTFYVLPSTLLQCQSVVTLHMSLCNFSLVSNHSRGINWTSLKVLHIEETKVGDGVFDEILNGSPSLEYLKLGDCRGMNHLRVHSRKLRELVIDGYTDLMYYYSEIEGEDQVEVDDPTLVISAPYLQELRLLGYWAGKTAIDLEDIPSLVECELDFKLTADNSREPVAHNMLRRLFRELTCVNKLVIGRWSLQVLPRVLSEARDFSFDCRNLVLRSGADEWQLAGIAEMLKCTLSVEKLVIDLFSHKRYGVRSLLTGNNDIEEEFRRMRETKLISLLSRLKSVKVLGFRADAYCLLVEYWLSLINLLLADTLVLEELVINVKSINAARIWELLDVAHKILRYQRGSSACKVVLNYPFMKESSCSA